MRRTNRKTSGDGLVKQKQAEPRYQDRRGRQSRGEIPTRDYAALVAVFNGLLATALLARKCSREPLPERVEPKDLAPVCSRHPEIEPCHNQGQSDERVSRAVHRSERETAPGEVEERAKGRGLRRAIGELLTCPFCLGTWIASGFIYGYVFVRGSVARWPASSL